MKPLSQANAVLTGASRGLGVHMARALADRQVNLALVARSAEDLAVVQADIAGRGVKAVAIQADVTDPSARQRIVDQVENELGSIDILVNNAGVEVASAFEESEPDEMERVIQVNLTAPMLLTRAIVPGMLARRRGHVVNIASAAGKFGTPFQSAYSASKFGLIGLTQALRAEYVDSPVRFSVVCPGFVADDGMYARMEAADVRSPRLVGTTTPDKVARAVVKAIEADRAEVIVNGMPLRPLLVLADVAPQWYARLAKAFGLRDMMRRATTEVG